MNPARTGRWKGDDLIITVGGEDRLAQFDFVVSEIPRCQQATVLLHPLCGRFCKGAAIKPTTSLLCNSAIGCSQIRLPEKIPFSQWSAVFEIDRPRRVELPHLLGHKLQAPGVTGVQPKALFGDQGRGQNEVLEFFS